MDRDAGDVAADELALAPLERPGGTGFLSDELEMSGRTVDEDEVDGPFSGR